MTDGLYSLWQQMIFKRYLNARYSFFIENMSGDLVNSVDFTFRDSDYVLTEAHAEEEHDDHGDEHDLSLIHI